MRLFCSLALIGALAVLAVPSAVSAADLSSGAWLDTGRTHSGQTHSGKAKPSRGRHLHRVALSRDCRTGWWTCRCSGSERRPVWATRCR